MLKKYLKSSIIVLIQIAVLAVLAALLVPLLLSNTDSFNHSRTFFAHYKFVFLFIHGAFYLALYFLWPLWVRLLVNRNPNKVSLTQIEKALNARTYLVGALLTFELLHFLR